MNCLTAVITHLDAKAVDAHMSYLRAVCPASPFLVCHGGRRSEFERLSWEPAIFIEDPGLRAPFVDQSYTGLLTQTFQLYVRADPSIDLVYFIEFDHMILRDDFEDHLIAAVQRSGADFIGKDCIERNNTNEWHYLRWRNDPAINQYFAQISRHHDPGRRFGCLGSGMLMTRRALEAFAALPEPPPCYLELFIPTAIYQLGLRVDNFDRLGDLYLTVRWRPEYNGQEAIRAKREGRHFLHPFKDTQFLGEIQRTVGAS